MSDSPGQQTPTDDQQTPVEPQPGTPEYEQKMADLADSRSGQKSDESPQEDQTNSDGFQLQDEDGKYLGKYSSVEELAKAYKNLEGKLGQQKQGDDQETPNTADLPPKEEGKEGGDEESKEGDTPELSSVMEEFGQKYAENGGFSEEDYEALESKGFDRATVQVYEAGLQSLNQSRVNAAVEACGSEENFNQVRTWASENLSDAEYSAFSRQLSAAETAEDVGVIYATLATRYQNASGEANMVGDNAPSSTSSPTGFQSRAEQSAAVNDPRYKSDPAYRAEVEARMRASKF